LQVQVVTHKRQHTLRRGSPMRQPLMHLY
jgi:hypothetical protein